MSDILREYQRIWQLAFPERARERLRLQYAANPEKYRELARLRYAANPEKQRERNRLWDAANPEKKRAGINRRNARRRARMWGAVISSDVTKIYNKAILWRKLGFDVQVDHIIPLSKGGTHVPENLQIIYKADNLRKSTKLHYAARALFF